MLEVTDPRRVVINRCRKRYKLSRSKRSLGKLLSALERIQEKASRNNDALASDQAWFIAEETWSLVMRTIGPIDPKMETVFSCAPVPPEFEDKSDVERMADLLTHVLIAEEFGNSAPGILYVRILSLAIRITTDALLVSSPELFCTEVEQ